ncbi:MAG: ATP synthase F0 subunit B [Ruminococcaceae bacterium]|nr:ATP synthase F0 subunit B [Oscillospiraceae bacterium]
MELDTLGLINELEDIIDKGVAVPFTGRCLLDKEELLEILSEIRLKMPTDLEQAKWIKAERQNIINDARKEAEEIIKNANDQLIAMVDENEITKKATAAAAEIMSQANAEANAEKNSVYQYSDYLLENVEAVVLKTVRDLEQCIAIVKDSRNKLGKQ